MTQVIIWTIIFSFASSLSIVLLGQRDLFSRNLLDIKNLLLLLMNWKFILSMILALFSRYSFMIINSSLLKIPRLANSATTITAFITSMSLILVVIMDFIILKERPALNQLIGAVIILFGVLIILR